MKLGATYASPMARITAAVTVSIALLAGATGCGPSGDTTQEQETSSGNETSRRPGGGASEQPGTSNTPEVGDGQNEQNSEEGG